VTVVKESRYKE